MLFLFPASLVPLAGSADAEEDGLRIAVLGDSLSAGYRLSAEESFPAQLQKALRQAGYHVSVHNSSVSGDTTSGGLARLDWALAEKPDAVIVELGGNDALRGTDPQLTRANLDAILTRLKGAGVKILLAGMRAPRNLGRPYYTNFDRIYPDLAARHQVALFPFFLEGVAGRPELNLNDGIHPNAAGVQVIVRNILPSIEKLLRPLLKVQRSGTPPERAADKGGRQYSGPNLSACKSLR